jgi:hypothetical protein
MTPWEIHKFIEAKSRQRKVVAWRHGHFAGWGFNNPKKYPRSEAELFGTPENKPMSDDAMVNLGKMMFEQMKKHRPENVHRSR